ncbi:Di-sulfide bridge nucleocytoplasmic transport domain-containing protein [Cunninghamella echinulata]|nr:Di-sulfide bridge nucleocytoplasmic transport domain-containing protein [Cunninghamella echinulata]
MSHYFQRTGEAPMDFEYDQPNLFTFNAFTTGNKDSTANIFLSTHLKEPRSSIEEKQRSFMNNTKKLFNSLPNFNIPQEGKQQQPLDLNISSVPESMILDDPIQDSPLESHKNIDDHEITYTKAIVPYQPSFKKETSSSKQPFYSTMFNRWKKSKNAKEKEIDNNDKERKVENEDIYNNDNTADITNNNNEMYTTGFMDNNDNNIYPTNSTDNNNYSNNNDIYSMDPMNDNNIYSNSGIYSNNINKNINEQRQTTSPPYSSHVYPMSASFYHHDPIAHKKSLINYSTGLIRVGFQLALFSILLYVGLQFVFALNEDVKSKMTIYESESLERYFICSQEYDRNRCHPSTRLPAMEEECRQWQQCLYTPAWVGKTKVLAETFAEIINGFIDTISLKAIIVLGIIIILLSFSLKKVTPLPIPLSSSSS